MSSDRTEIRSRAKPRDAGQTGEFDVVVVGFGAAGACAAIEAASRGARVLLIDRFAGGGATARSGGIVYLGGGSALQTAAGYKDDPEQMFRYLRREVGEAVDEATLRAYCEGSLDDLRFLEELGVPFPARGTAPKTSYPGNEVTLYFSGNELCPPYSDDACSAPRGHRALGKGLTGDVLFDHLRRGVIDKGIELRTGCAARRLLTDAGGRVTGLVVRALPANWLLHKLHRALCELATGGTILNPTMGRLATRCLHALEQRFGVESEVSARGGVVLSAGGFIFNRQLVREHAPLFADAMPVGTVGDDGSGIELGRSAGGATDRMERIAAWRFINPPVSLTHGVLVNRRGRRVCNEQLYGGTLGNHIGYENEGRAHLIIDARIRRSILRDLVQFRKLNFQTTGALINLYLNRTKAGSLRELAIASAIQPEGLEKTIEEYNALARAGASDPHGKSANAFHPLETPPYYAIVCDFDSRWFPTPTFTMGGLRVDGSSGGVLRDNESLIAGLYAAGRNAVGISSNSYISGLSLGDCIFSGRRAGRHAAAAALNSADPQGSRLPSTD